QGAAQGAWPEIVNFAVAPHAHGLKNLARRGGRHHDRDQHPLHGRAPGEPRAGCVLSGVAPLTRATPAMISVMPVHRRAVMCSLSITLPSSATSTYPMEVTGST